MAQLHKKFEDHQVKELICCYLAKEIKRSYIKEILGIKRRRFCKLVKDYHENTGSFSVEYKRKVYCNKLIGGSKVLLTLYNYSYLKVGLLSLYERKVTGKIIYITNFPPPIASRNNLYETNTE